MALLEGHDVEAMIRLLAEAADPTVEMPLKERKLAILEGLGQLIDADAWSWITGRVELPLANDTMATSLVDGGWKDEHQRAEFLRISLHPELSRVVYRPFYSALAEQRCVTKSRHEVISEEAWQASEVAKPWRVNGFDHFMLSVYPLVPHGYSAIGLHRHVGKAGYSERDRTIVHILMQQVDWLHHAGTDVPAAKEYVSLSPRERQIMIYVLAGGARQEIAAKIGLSEHTVADYMKQIYHKFNVNSRAELLAQFISGGQK